MHCLRSGDEATCPFMIQRRFPTFRRFSILCGMLMSLMVPRQIVGEPAPAAVSSFNSYVSAVEARLGQQRRSQSTFFPFGASAPQNEQRLRREELIIEDLTPPTRADLSGALLHHWRGTAFVPGAKAADFERLLSGFNAYPRHFYPQVLQARVLTRRDDHLQALIRVRQKHVITVVMDTTYNVTFGRLDARHGYSTSRSTRISEIDSPGTDRERALNSSEEHGFLWRLNTYWSYEEGNGGLYIQIESISLSRSIPAGLGWALRPYVESVPRESLEFTLRSARNAIQK
jgi:hypothetical protein